MVKKGIRELGKEWRKREELRVRKLERDVRKK